MLIFQYKFWTKKYIGYSTYDGGGYISEDDNDVLESFAFTNLSKVPTEQLLVERGNYYIVQGILHHTRGVDTIPIKTVRIKYCGIYRTNPPVYPVLIYVLQIIFRYMDSSYCLTHRNSRY